MATPGTLHAYNPSEHDLSVHLDLSGEALKSALAGLLASGEQHGGIERVVEAMQLKNELFRDAFANGGEDLTRGIIILSLCEWEMRLTSKSKMISMVF